MRRDIYFIHQRINSTSSSILCTSRTQVVINRQVEIANQLFILFFLICLEKYPSQSQILKCSYICYSPLVPLTWSTSTSAYMVVAYLHHKQQQLPITAAGAANMEGNTRSTLPTCSGQHTDQLAKSEIGARSRHQAPVGFNAPTVMPKLQDMICEALLLVLKRHARHIDPCLLEQMIQVSILVQCGDSLRRLRGLAKVSAFCGAKKASYQRMGKVCRRK